MGYIGHMVTKDLFIDERLARRDIGTDEHWPGSGSLRPELLDGEPMAWSGLDVDDTFSAGPVRVQSLADFGGNIDVARVVTAGPPPAIWLG